MRYSERRKLDEEGTLGDLIHDHVSDEMATAIRALMETAQPLVRELFYDRLTNAAIRHFGVGQPWHAYVSGGMKPDALLDLVEIAAEEATTPIAAPNPERGGKRVTRIPIMDFESAANRIFERFLFGYRIEGGQVRKIGSPALEEAIVGPALLAVQRPGWEEVERSFRKALQHQRAGEHDDALTAASASVEAALRAAGMTGTTLKKLAQSFRGSGLVPAYLERVPELLEDLLDRLHAARSTDGDAHGKPPGSPAVPAPLADLGVYWAGGFIAYLADTVGQTARRTAPGPTTALN